MNRSRLVPALVLATVCALASSQLSGAQSAFAGQDGTALTASAVATTCADVLFLGARGSGEKGPGSPGWIPTTGDPAGLGSRVLSAEVRVVADLAAHRTVQIISVDYPASTVVRLINGNAQAYFDGLGAGTNAAVAELVSQAAACPNQSIVLAGYSQGAMAMHGVLRDLQQTTSGKAILARVDSAILIADGDQVANDTVTRYGSASASASGVGLAFTTLTGASTKKFTATVGAKVLSVCNHHDPVCDWTVADLANFSIHLGYVGTPPVVSAADEAALAVRSNPLPTPRTVSLSGTVNQAFNYQLTADIDSAYSLQWRLASGSLPPGVNLASSGALSGSPTTSGSYSAGVQVRGIVLGVTTAWVSATVQVTVAPRQSSPTITNYTISGVNFPAGMTKGPDGAMWFTNAATNSVGRITTAGSITLFTSSKLFQPSDIVSGPDGALWIASTGNSSIVRVTTSGVFTSYSGSGISSPFGIAAGPDGALWFTNSTSSIGRITLAGVVSLYSAPSVSVPSAITVGPDGALWFTNEGNASVGRVTVAGVISNFAGPALAWPRGIVAGPDGALWVTNTIDTGCCSTGSIVRLTTAGVMTSYSNSSVNWPHGIVVGADGALWFVNVHGPSVGRISTGGVITSYSDGTLNTPWEIAAGPDGALWFTNNGNNSIGRITTS